MKFSVASIGTNQDLALVSLAALIGGDDPESARNSLLRGDNPIRPKHLPGHGLEHPRVRATALAIVHRAGCAGRDDMCELEALFDWTKENFPYRADPKSIDFFVAPERSLLMVEKGAPGGDCDEHVTVLGALAGSLGFTVGARAYGARQNGDFSHVYAVALVPKKAERPEDGRIVGLDTTVPSARVGWQPPPGRYRTAWATPD